MEQAKFYEIKPEVLNFLIPSKGFLESPWTNLLGICLVQVLRTILKIAL
jgi:hypothetical protein